MPLPRRADTAPRAGGRRSVPRTPEECARGCVRGGHGERPAVRNPVQQLMGRGEVVAMAVQDPVDRDTGVHQERITMAGSATSQEAGRFPSVPPPQSRSRKRGLTLPQLTVEGVPSMPSTFSGVVQTGLSRGPTQEREGSKSRPPCSYRYVGDSHSARGGTSPTKAWHSAAVSQQ